MSKRHLFVGAIIVFVAIRLFGSDSPPSPGTLSADVNRETGDLRQSGITFNQIPSSSPEEVTAPKQSTPSSSVTNNPSSKLPVLFVRGNAVALRDAPSTQGKILDRFDRGRAVALIMRQEEWSRVRDELTRKEGWIATRFLSDTAQKPEQPVVKKPSVAKPPQPSAPVMTDAVIIERIIAESLATYPGSCPCPYNSDRGGRRCGKRSAYSKPGGYAPICYSQDVTKSMIEAFRGR